MFKFIGALVVYGFATYGLTLFLNDYQERVGSESESGELPAAGRVFNVVK